MNIITVILLIIIIPGIFIVQILYDKENEDKDLSK